MSFNKNLLTILNFTQDLPRTMNDDLLIIIGTFLGHHPVARLIQNMEALTWHAPKEEFRDRDLGQDPEYMDDSVFDELKKYNSFEEHGGQVGYNPTFVWHLIGCRTLSHDHRADYPNEGWEAWQGLNTNANACVAKIYFEYHFEIGRMREWEEMYPEAQLCSNV